MVFLEKKYKKFSKKEEWAYLYAIAEIYKKHSSDSYPEKYNLFKPHPLKDSEIIQILDKEYGLSAHRHTIEKYIKILEEHFNYVFGINKKGKYLLSDGCSFSNYFTNKLSLSLLATTKDDIPRKELLMLATKNHLLRMKYYKDIYSDSDTINAITVKNLTTIIEARRKGIYVHIKTNSLETDDITILPIFLISKNGKFYMMYLVAKELGYFYDRTTHPDNSYYLIEIGQIISATKETKLKNYAQPNNSEPEKYISYLKNAIELDSIRCLNKDVEYIDYYVSKIPPKIEEIFEERIWKSDILKARIRIKGEYKNIHCYKVQIFANQYEHSLFKYLFNKKYGYIVYKK